MKRLATLLVSAVILSSCVVVPIWDIARLKSNPFIEPVDLSAIGHSVEADVVNGELKVESIPIDLEVPAVIQFPIVTDVHAGRSDSGSHLFTEPFLAFLEAGDYPFLVDLGDLLDDDEFDNRTAISFYAETASRANGNHILCIGNHELHQESAEEFDKFLSSFGPERETARMGRYVFGPLSIYKLDNSVGAFGREQLDYLEKALEADESPYKIFIAHVNMATGGTPDHSLILTGMTDQREVHRVMRLMDEHDVPVIITGHHHKGNIEYHFTKHTGELNAAAFHRRDTAIDMESRGYFYLFELNTINGDISIHQYDAETGAETGKLFHF